jgi:O-antigen/teichoic acid export membrane protein
VGGADLAFQVIIWSIPIGFVNSVTQYVLIAVNQQHTLTRAFVLGVVFNVVGNFLLIPSFGYVGAATATILSEFSLLIPFYIMVRRHVGVVPWARVVAPPLISAAAMGAITYGLIQAASTRGARWRSGWWSMVLVCWRPAPSAAKIWRRFSARCRSARCAACCPLGKPVTYN